MTGVPTAVESERVVLAMILTNQRCFAQVRGELSDDDWFLPVHERIWHAICELAECGAADFVAIYDHLSADAGALRALTELSGVQPAGSLSWHCGRIRDTATGRAVLGAGQRLVQRAEEGTDPVGLAEETIDELRGIQRAGTTEAASAIDFTDLVARVVDPARFVIPGLLARRNRIILTAPEGYGKSSALRQIAACASAGVHPFKTKGRYFPAVTVVFDAENPQEINTVEYRRLYDNLGELGVTPERGMLTVDECGDQNLLDGRIASRFYALIEKLRPQLIVIGPLYKLHEEDPNAEGPARKLSAVLDRMMRISDAAMVIEAHTPHNDGPLGQLLRPYGASLWKRWPDFGYCLHPVVTPRRNSEPTAEEQLSMQMRESYFTPWRGNRALRDWPARLGVGQILPWGAY